MLSLWGLNSECTVKYSPSPSRVPLGYILLYNVYTVYAQCSPSQCEVTPAWVKLQPPDSQKKSEWINSLFKSVKLL